MLNSFINLIFPRICYACKNPTKKEFHCICFSCRNALARHHRNHSNNDPVEQIFLGRLKLEKATAFLKFEKNARIQSLLHNLKYKGVSDIGTELGKLAGVELEISHFFDGIDVLLPIPIHPKKQKKRGYNQSHFIAKGISNVTGLSVDKTSIIKQINTSSQTKKSRFERHNNVNDSFKLIDRNTLQNKHILLIDDVVTTGSTVETCGNLLKEIPGVQLSLLTIAFTY